MGSGFHDPPAIHDEDAVCILNRGNTLGDDDLCGVRKLMFKCLTDQGISLCIDCGSRVVRDEALRFLSDRSRDAETLFLAAGDVRSALFDIGVISIRELCDELVRLR